MNGNLVREFSNNEIKVIQHDHGVAIDKKQDECEINVMFGGR